MKEPKRVITGLIVLVLLLVGYCVFITKRLSRVEASGQELQVKHRILADAVSHIEVSPELIRALAAAMAKESPPRPAFTDRELLRFVGAEVNSPPPSSSSK